MGDVDSEGNCVCVGTGGNGNFTFFNQFCYEPKTTFF